MREVQERHAWSNLRKRRGAVASDYRAFDWSCFIDLSQPCTVIGGRNGAGKSRILRQVDELLGEHSLLIDLHHLCEQALMVLRSRADLDEMIEEFGVVGPDGQRLSDVQRIVGREYELVEWYSLDLQPADELIARRFCWAGEQPLIPYFRAQYRGRSYGATDMGLGEFSIHFLFWILEQYREAGPMTILLDEPDAYLPPIGVERLLARLLNLCGDREWNLILTSHSEELIAQAVEQDQFILVSIDDDGGTRATHSRDHPRVADDLLSRPTIDRIYFVEDETAFYLLGALLDVVDRRRGRSSVILWSGGSGELVRIRKHLPRTPSRQVRFACVFDGDQRSVVAPSTESQWPGLFLPTNDDPDLLLMRLREHPDLLAERLGLEPGVLRLTLDGLEGADPHDWVNGVGQAFGRPFVLARLADLWCELNPTDVTKFGEELDAQFG